MPKFKETKNKEISSLSMFKKNLNIEEVTQKSEF